MPIHTRHAICTSSLWLLERTCSSTSPCSQCHWSCSSLLSTRSSLGSDHLQSHTHLFWLLSQPEDPLHRKCQPGATFIWWSQGLDHALSVILSTNRLFENRTQSWLLLLSFWPRNFSRRPCARAPACDKHCAVSQFCLLLFWCCHTSQELSRRLPLWTSPVLGLGCSGLYGQQSRSYWGRG